MAGPFAMMDELIHDAHYDHSPLVQELHRELGATKVCAIYRLLTTSNLRAEPSDVCSGRLITRRPRRFRFSASLHGSDVKLSGRSTVCKTWQTAKCGMEWRFIIRHTIK